MQDAETAKDIILQRCRRPEEFKQQCVELAEARSAKSKPTYLSLLFAVDLVYYLIMSQVACAVPDLESSSCRVPKLDEFLIALSNIAQTEHIKEAVSHGPDEATSPSSGVHGLRSQRDATTAGHGRSPAAAGSPAALQAPKLAGTSLAETPAYAKRLGRPPVTPGAPAEQLHSQGGHACC